ncbi:MAG: uridine kinase [Anaerolineae bacterium]|jgi:uridine kinase|nr:uridine kinase [Anaerolineae bacterium]
MEAETARMETPGLDRPFTIGVAGGTGSGKTTAAQEIIERVGNDKIAYLPHDAYYKDLRHLPPNQRKQINFDHPDSLDNALMVQHLRQLLAWQPVDIPIYDFANDTRTGQTIHVEPNPIILVEGILIFGEPELRKLLDFKIFVDTDADIRFIRRLQRDTRERGRTVESVISQYLTTVRPMHMEFVEPSRRYADIIIPEMVFNHPAIDMVADRIRMLTMRRATR